MYQGSKIINCYSTGKMVPLGHGTTNFGGIAGTVGAGTEIRHCYFAGEMDLSQYTATTPYKRLGGIAGGVSSDTPVFENNYFVETENVPACFKYQDAGTEKTLDFMKTEDFFNEITAAGGNYRFNSNGTPLLPAPKYTVSFVVTPAELANVVIKVNGQEVANPITITADTATHTQTIAMTYLPADYTKVDEAIAKANALNKPYILHRNGASPIVMRGVQKCTGAGAALRDRNVQPLCCINLDTATDPSCCQDQFFILSHKGVQPGSDPLDPALHVGVEQCVLQGGLGSGHIVIDITDGGQIPVGSWDDVMAVCLLKDHICHCQFFCLISSLIRYLATSRSRRSCRSRR